MNATCDIIFNDQESTYEITVYDELGFIYETDCFEDLFNYCKSNNIKQLFFYDGKIAFSYFDYFVLINDWKRIEPSRKGVMTANQYKTLIGSDGQRYSMLLGLGNRFHLRLRNLSLLAKGGLSKACQDFCVEESVIKVKTIMNLLNVLQKAFLELTEIDIVEDKVYTIGAIAKRYQLELIEQENGRKFHEIYKIDTDRNKLLMTQNLVRGGVCYFNEALVGKNLTNCRKYDYNSSYPYIMRNYPMPAGKFIASRTIPNDNKLHFICFKYFKMNLKPNRLPLHSDVLTGENKPRIRYDEMDTFWLWEDELKALQRYYDIEYQIKVCFSFEPFYDKGMKAYVDKFYPLKSRAKGAKRTCIKLLLNSIYGKFGENIYRDSVYYELRDGVAHKVVEKIDHSDNNSMKYLSVIVSSYIAAMGRARILNEVLDICGDRLPQDFVYCDTDCIVIRGDYQVKTSKTELGAFKDEGSFTSFKVLAKKTYIGYCEDKLLTVHAPGVDNTTLVSFYQNLTQEEGIAAFNNTITFTCPIYVIKSGGIVLDKISRRLADRDSLRYNGILIKEI